MEYRTVHARTWTQTDRGGYFDGSSVKTYESKLP